VIALLERGRELDVIHAGLAAARNGEGRLVLVEGPAGIGKSALVVAARAQAGAEGYRVLSAAGGELEGDFPYGVVRQLFAPALTRPGSEELLGGAAALARTVLALDLAEHDASQLGDSSPLEALHGLYWLTVNLGADQPILLAVDDVHWCDGASLRFLLYLRRRLDGLPVLLLAAARTGEPGVDEHLLGLLSAAGGSDVLQPQPLSREGTAALVRRALSEEPDPSFVTAAHAATAGNPFLLSELITTLVDREMRPTADAADHVSAIGPQGVRSAILRRLGRLAEGATALARAAAVLGSGAELRHAAALAELSDETAAALVEALVRTQILRDERRISFVHPLVRAAIYLDVPATVRAQAHAQAARILAGAGAGDDAIAAHLLETDPAGDDAVVQHLRAAARRAAGKGAMDVAATYLRRALAEPPAAVERGAVLRELGAAELAAGQPETAAERLEAAALEADDLDASISIALMRRNALLLADRIAEAVTVVDEVRSQAGASQSDLLEAAAVGAGYLDFDVVRQIEDRLAGLQARAAEPTVREPLLLAVAAATSAYANRPLAEIVALTERTIAALPEAHDASYYSVEGQLSAALYLSEQYELLFEFAGRGLEDARRRGSIPRFISTAISRSGCAFRSGALADAEADARDALEAARLYGHHFWLPGAVAALINPLVEYGRYDEGEDVLADTRVEERHGRSSALGWVGMLLPARGRLRAAEGRLHEGLADLLACGERYESAANRSPTLWSWRSEAALALAALGDSDRARELAAEEVRLARVLAPPRALGIALRAAGLVAGGSEGLVLLRESEAVLATSGAALEHARALVDHGSALRRAGHRADARPVLREGLEFAVSCGAEVLATRAREELSATGARPRRDRLRGPEALTPSERRVAQMAAEGRSNPEIAQALFLTRRTVETHLTHVYRKLDIRSREELAAALDPRALERT
jgi:DNA-binding CsgD family transcriptional regulator/tetratricopeptide (TPR) repeat protein